MPRRIAFILYPLPFILLTACDSNSLNQSDVNPLVILAAQFAEGSMGSSNSTSAPATQPKSALLLTPSAATSTPAPSYQPPIAPPARTPTPSVASPQHHPLTASNPPADITTPW